MAQFAGGRPFFAWLNLLRRSNLLRSKLHTRTPGLKPTIVVRLFAGLKARASTKKRFQQTSSAVLSACLHDERFRHANAD
jgi:hypothetical protein